MFSFIINLPNINIVTNITEDHGIVFNLYVNAEYEGSYPSKTDLEYRIGLIINNEINEELNRRMNK